MKSAAPTQDQDEEGSAATRHAIPKRTLAGGGLGSSTPERIMASSGATATSTTTTTTSSHLYRSLPPVPVTTAVTPDSELSPRRPSAPNASTQLHTTLSLLLLPKKYRGFKKKRKEEKLKKLQLNDEASSSGESYVVDDEIVLKHDLTRRRRKSLNKSKELYSSTIALTWMCKGIDGIKINDANVSREDHFSPLLRAWMEPSKTHMMDVTLEGGKDHVSVPASKFLLACFSPVLEEIFYKQGECQHYDAEASKLVIGFCSSEVIKAAMHHCFGSGELPPEFDVTTPSEEVARNLAQLDHLARVYKFSALAEVTYRAIRKLINRRVVLACAIFDELSYRKGHGAVDSIKRYALDLMRDMPMDTLLSGGVQWMKEESVESIMQDQDMDVDEFYMFKILKTWAAVTGENRFAVAVRLSKHIQLKFIEPALLNSQVKESGFFGDDKIDEAVRLITESLANRDPSEMERVLVEGSGTDIVNGIYCRVDGELGMGEEEVLFVKEADDGFSDVGLYLWGTRWNIAMCVDFSNCFYSCEDPRNKCPHEFVPARNWVVEHGGSDPAPICTYLPNTRIGRLNILNNKLAPNLEEMLDPSIAEKRRSSYFDKNINDLPEKRTLTLEQMMNLPQDSGEGDK